MLEKRDARCRVSGKRAEPRQHVVQLRGRELLPGDFAAGEGVLHVAAVVPHLLHHHHRVGQRFPFRDRRRVFTARLVDAVAIAAVLLGEGRLAARGVARLIEESGRVEIGEQVGGVAGRELGVRIPAVSIAPHITGAWFHIVLARWAGV